MQLFILSLVMSLIFSPLLADPFKITFPAKEKLTIEDYVEVQKQLQDSGSCTCSARAVCGGRRFPGFRTLKLVVSVV